MDESNEIRIFGPPGTGKTTTLSGLIVTACQEVGSDAVLVSSFTRTAAKELVQRDLPLDENRIGTLHALCYRSLDRPRLVSKEHLKDWNQEHTNMRMGGVTVNPDDPYADFDGGSDAQGDALLQAYNRMRGLQIPEDGWPLSVQSFAQAWRDFKDQTFTVDFTDLIERCLIERLEIPHGAKVFFLDEVQDFSPLELSLARHWGSTCDTFYLAGDDDQCLYHFKGATPDAFLYPELPAEQVRVLAQSYRVPRAVHAAAMSWVEGIGARKDKQYCPRDFEGSVETLPVNYKYVDPLLGQIEEWLEAGKSIAFLASCSYMIDPLKHKLRSWGLPFHNPYRHSRGDWNPLSARAGAVSSSARILAYRKVADHQQWWTNEEVWQWAASLEAEGVFSRGSKTAIRRLAEDEQVKGLPASPEDLEAWFSDPVAGESATAGDVEWLRSHLLSAYEKPMNYACAVLDARGPDALVKAPQIMIGTIHCSPEDEPILTTDGVVPIGQLDSNEHRLASYTDATNRLLWGGRNGKNGYPRKEMGYPFTVGRRSYCGPLLTVTTDASRTRVTPEHKMQVRFTESFFNKWIVYLMRKGNWWRVGFCTSGTRPYKCGGLKGRMATEQADDGWILGVYLTKRDAVREELRVQCQYGIPGLTFEVCKSRSFRSEDIRLVHESIRSIVEPRAAQLLKDRGLLIDSPLCQRGQGARTNQRGMFLTQAANLLSGFMELPTVSPEFQSRSRNYAKKPAWKALTMTVDPAWQGDVYSLDVRPYHHYISGGAVVHNSFKGAEADVVVLFPDLSVSGFSEWTTPGEPQDSIRRMFYVGMTRAREALYWAQPIGMSIGGYL